MGERDWLKKGLVTQFGFLTSDLGFRGPRIIDRSLLLTLLYRSVAFDLKIYAELRDWFLDFHVIPPKPIPAADGGTRPWISSYDLITPFFAPNEKALFDKAALATAPRDVRGSVPAMLEAVGCMAALLRTLVPRLREQPDLLLKAGRPGSR